MFAAMGEAEAGVDSCRRALETAPDPLNTAIARGWLGYAGLETGRVAQRARRGRNRGRVTSGVTSS